MRSWGIFFCSFLYCYRVLGVACYALMVSRQGRIRRISVDEGFAVSSGLLDLVVVLVNDVEEHRLEEQG